MKKMNQTTEKLVVSAMFIALSTVLSVIPAIQLPLGGKATILSMLPVMLIPLRYDFKWGVLTSFVYAVIQMALSFAKVLSWGLTPIVLIAAFLLDYIFAYWVLCFAGAFKKLGYKGHVLGVCVALVLRFLMHFISGIVLWGDIVSDGIGAIIYSITYNGSYMLPELIFTIIALIILMKTNAYKRIVG